MEQRQGSCKIESGGMSFHRGGGVLCVGQNYYNDFNIMMEMYMIVTYCENCSPFYI